jgi:hypothetical protein
MTVTYDRIATTTLGSATASITFSSISSAYTDLVLISNAKATVSGTNLMFRFNSDSGTNYGATMIKGNGTAASAYRYSNGTNGQIGEYNNVQFGTYITNFQNYSNTTTFKTVLTRSNVANDHTSAWVSLWRSTSAVNSISVVSDGGNIESGSTFTLYGIAREV